MPSAVPESTTNTNDISFWQPMLFAAMAGGLGWGIRGQYGHETGAMIAGVLVSLTLVFLLCPTMPLLPVLRAAALGTVAMGIGGTMTYGVTLGLSQDPELVGNWSALRWGLLGCAVKGSVWIGFAGLFLGIGLGGKRYTPLEMFLLLLAMLAAAFVGMWLLNSPFDPEARRLPAIHFSNLWHWLPDSESRPRAESWGGLHAALLLGIVYCAVRKKDALARNMGLWGLLGGALGFPIGQSLQAYHAWNPAVFDQGIWTNLDPYMNWWNTMETTFGCIMGATLGLGLWLNRRRIDLAPDHEEKTLPPVLAWSLLALHVFLITRMTFYAGWAEAIYDFGIILAIIPFVCNIRGHVWPWFQITTITLIPIAAKTVTELVRKSETLPLFPGWLLYFVVPLALATGLAVWGTRFLRTDAPSHRFVAIALLVNVWIYFALNFAIFRFPWPWAEWTGRTPSGIVFTVFTLALTAMVVVTYWRRKVADTAS